MNVEASKEKKRRGGRYCVGKEGFVVSVGRCSWQQYEKKKKQ